MKRSPSTPVRVIKLGGSLLTLPDLTSRLERWLTRQPPMFNLCIVGGGQPVQNIRDLGCSADSSESHWSAVQQMDVHARSLSQRSPNWIYFDSLNSYSFISPTTINFFGVENWLRNEIHCLPESWDVTSDSIAVILARFLNAEELILLKSTIPQSDRTLIQLIDEGYVDRHFKTALTSSDDHQLSTIEHVKFVNFRDKELMELKL